MHVLKSLKSNSKLNYPVNICYILLRILLGINNMGFRLRPSAITYEKCIPVDSTLTACGLTVIDTSNGWLILTVNLNKI